MPRKQAGEIEAFIPVIRDGELAGIREVHVDTLTCAHCNRVVMLNPERKRARGFCYRCDNYVCDFPICRSECNPIIQSVELLWKYQGTEFANQPFLNRGKDGAILFRLELRDAERIF